MGGHPRRGGMDQAVRRRERRADVADRLGTPGPEPPVQGLGEGASARFVLIEDEEPVDPELQRRMGDGDARTARSQKNRRSERDVGKPRAKTLEEAETSRCCGRCGPVAEHHGVDRASIAASSDRLVRCGSTACL